MQTECEETGIMLQGSEVCKRLHHLGNPVQEMASKSDLFAYRTLKRTECDRPSLFRIASFSFPVEKIVIDVDFF